LKSAFQPRMVKPKAHFRNSLHGKRFESILTTKNYGYLNSNSLTSDNFDLQQDTQWQAKRRKTDPMSQHERAFRTRRSQKCENQWAQCRPPHACSLYASRQQVTAFSVAYPRLAFETPTTVEPQWTFVVSFPFMVAFALLVQL
jgi:hypothetical protein